MTLSISLLGTFDIRHGRRQVTGFRAQSVRALLAYLALEANRPHEREHLCALLWPDLPLPSALANLRQALHRLHEALGPAGEAGPYLLITRHSVQLNAAAVLLDTARFQEALASVAAHSHCTHARCEPCLALMHDALGHYRGDLLPGFSLACSEPFEEWLRIERERLRARLYTLLDSLSIYHLQRGEHRPAVELLRRWVSLDPWSEQAQRRLIDALASSGERPLALRQFEHYRALLADELGVEPSDEVKELVAQVRAGALARGRRGVVRHAPDTTRPLTARPGEPELLTTMLGQPSCRLATLTGHSGSDRAHLALEAAAASAHAFADGALFVSLTTLRHAQQLPRALAEALGLAAAAGRPLLEQVIESLRERELLLVLEDCEQVQELVPLLDRLLTAAPRLTVLATSCAALNLRAEWVVPLEGLTLAERSAGR